MAFRSFDAGYSNGWDMASVMHPQTILAYGLNDQALPHDHGAPLRLYAPTKLGYKLTKYLLSMTFTDRRPGGYWEDQGYPWFGGVGARGAVRSIAARRRSLAGRPRAGATPPSPDRGAGGPCGRAPLP